MMYRDIPTDDLATIENLLAVLVANICRHESKFNPILLEVISVELDQVGEELMSRFVQSDVS